MGKTSNPQDRRPHAAQASGHWRWKAIDQAQVQSLLDQGMTQLQVATQLGVSLNTIERRVRSWGLQTARTGPRLAQGHKFCWEDGRTLDKHGYVEVYAPMHPHARARSGKVFEHRLLMEVVLGRYLQPKEVVHHLDDHPRHNFPENLSVYATNADHLRAELTGRKKASPRSSTPGAYGCNQSAGRCPSADETLARTPLETRLQLERHIEIHRPTKEQQTMTFRSILRLGARLPPFQ